MADPRIEHVPAWDSADIPEGWRTRCCPGFIGEGGEPWSWYADEATAVTDLAYHLDHDHGLTVTALLVLDLKVPAGTHPDTAHEAGEYAVKATRLVRLADLPAEADA